MEHHREILNAIINSFNKTSSMEEEKLLNDWLVQSKDHKKSFRKILKILVLAKDTSLAPKIDKQKAWAIIDQQTSSVKVRKLRLGLWKYAAAILLPLMLGTTVYYFIDQNNKQIASEKRARLEAIQPGSSKATLVLADGSRITLDSIQNGTIAQQENTAILKIEEGKLEYNTQITSLNEEENSQQPNILVIPRGGEYQLTLSDGTKVWLNSNTKFEFPANFSGTKRQVKLKGEAYFEVAKNESKPFIVNINDKAQVKVLGTQFNINAYEDENSIKTTLVEGSVQINPSPFDSLLSSFRPLVLTPGEQARIDNKGNLMVKNVDTERCILWKDGIFNFENASLSELTRQLRRWYKIDFAFEDEALKSINFNGAVKKDKPLAAILDVLKETNHIDYKLTDNNVIVITERK